MTNQQHSDKKDFVSIALLAAEHFSRDKETAEQFLQSDGVDTTKFVANGLKKLKQMQLLANAKRTEQQMQIAEKVKAQATAWVDNMLENIDFSLTDLVKAEHLSMSFRNIESLSKDDIRNILIQHFTLKMMGQQDTDTP